MCVSPFVFTDLTHQGFYFSIFSDTETLDLFISSGTWLQTLLPLGWCNPSWDSRQAVQGEPQQGSGTRTAASLGNESQRVKPGQAVGMCPTRLVMSPLWPQLVGEQTHRSFNQKLSWGSGLPEAILSHIIISVPWLLCSFRPKPSFPAQSFLDLTLLLLVPFQIITYFICMWVCLFNIRAYHVMGTVCSFWTLVVKSCWVRSTPHLGNHRNAKHSSILPCSLPFLVCLSNVSFKNLHSFLIFFLLEP